MPDVVNELLASEVAVGKLGGRSIAADEARQLPRNRYVVVRNPNEPREPGMRRMLIGRTDGGRTLTLVIERTLDPTTWLIVTGWSSTDVERKLLEEEAMSTDPWTADDPQPGDFDAVLATIDPAYVEYHEGNPDATLRILVSVEGDDVRRLERLVEASGKSAHAVVAELLRDADRPAA